MADNLKTICKRSELIDGTSGGHAIRFTIQRNEKVMPCFVVAFEDAIYAYANRCPHQGTELDWLPGEVFDDEGLYLMCATHGAVFEADSGLCAGGPCRGLSLERILVCDVDSDVMLVEDVLTGVREDVIAP